MSDWFTEKQTPHYGLTLEIEERLFDEKSPFQHVEVMRTKELGNMLVLDGCVMTTEKDEYVYHEMIAHPALFIHPNPSQVLVIGGGDGGSVREVVKHQRVNQVTLVEIDGMVLDVSRRFLPSIACELDNPKVEVKVADGFAHLDEHQGVYDVILVDSTDPVGPAEALFSQEFFQKVVRSLKPDGLAVFQSESPFFHTGLLAKMHQDLRGYFSNVALYTVHIPTYPSGWWSFTICSNTQDPAQAPLPKDEPPFMEKLKYYNFQLHQAAFALPSSVRRALKG